MRKRTVLSVTLLTALVLLAGLDKSISNFIYTLRTPLVTSIMKGLSFAGSVWILVPLCLGLLFYLYRKDRFFAWIIPLGTLFCHQVSSLLKWLIQRSRPDLSPLVEEKSFSFPSGHAMANTAFYVLLYLAARKEPRAGIFAFIMIILIDFSRIYLGVHWPSDVLGGTALSLILITLSSHKIKQLR